MALVTMSHAVQRDRKSLKLGIACEAYCDTCVEKSRFAGESIWISV